jgi:hypothetical protein
VDANQNVRFAHESVREYLRNKRIGNIQEFAIIKGHTQAAETCLACLTLSNIDVSQITSFRLGVDLPGYVVLYWPTHCQMAGANRTKGDLWVLIRDFMSKGEFNAKFAVWTRKLRVMSPSLVMPWPAARTLENVAWLPPNPFFTACAWGFCEVVEHLLSSGNTELSMLEQQRNQGLRMACESGQPRIVKMLLEATPKPNIDAQDEWGATALRCAVIDGHVEVVKVLLEADPKPNINAQDEYGMTAFHYAAIQGHVWIVKMLLEAGPQNILHVQNRFGNTALHCAVQQNQNYQLIALLARATYASSSQHISFLEHSANDTGNIMEIVESLIELNPNDGILRRCLGCHYVRLHRYKKASEAFDMSMYLKMKQSKVTRVEDILRKPIAIIAVRTLLGDITNAFSVVGTTICVERVF